MNNTKTLYIVRHGQTDYNKNELVQGRGIDAPLNLTGQAQGQALFSMYGNVDFEKIYTSTLQRTHQTIAGFIAKDLPWQQLSGLDEMYYGSLEGKPIAGEGNTSVGAVRAKWNAGYCNVPLPEGESPENVRDRQQVALQVILESPEKLVLVAMHSRAMRILLCWMLDLDLKHMESFDMPNSCLYIIDYNFDKKKYTVRKKALVTHLA